MDSIFAVVCVGAGLYGLITDYKKRKQFNNVVQTGSDANSNYQLMVGTVKSNRPIEFTNLETKITDDVIVQQTITKSRNYHTHYGDKTIYDDGKHKIIIPVKETYEVWTQDNVSTRTAPNIFIDNSFLFFTKDSAADWDKKSKRVVNNSKISDYILVNNHPRTVFAQKNGTDTFTIKYIGNEKFVHEKIRGDHFGINNGVTTIFGIAFALSAGYLVNNCANRDRK